MVKLRVLATLTTLVPAFAGTLVVLPVLTGSAAAARPVTPTFTDRAMTAVPALADGTPRQARALLASSLPYEQLRAQHLTPFETIGVTWDDAAATAPIRITISTHTDGKWTEPTVAEATDVHPDRSIARTGTDPIWVGTSDGYRVQVQRAGAGQLPTGLKVTTIDPGTAPADSTAAPAAAAQASAQHPPIVSRAQWGADESLMNWTHQYAPSVKVVFIHHTDSINNYSRAQAPALVRSIYAYHTVTLGWGDIGYNFLVDKYGTVYEGRSGGVTTAVVAGHTYGFNYATSGIGLIGNFSTTPMSDAMFSSLEHLIAWKLSLNYRNPQGTQPLTAGLTQRSGTGRSFTAGSTYDFNVISGHRDGYQTDCPGNQVYSRIPQIRKDVARLMGARLYDPVAVPLPGTLSLPGGIQVSSHFGGTLNWQVTVQSSDGTVVAKYSGRSSYSMTQKWSLLDGLVPIALPGTYRVTLTANDGITSAYPAIFTVTLSSPSGGLLYPSGTFLRQGSSYWRMEQQPNGTILRRPVIASAVQTYPTIGQAISPPAAVLNSIPSGSPLPWADGTLLSDGVSGITYVMTNGVFRRLNDLSAYGYTPSQVLVVPSADLAQYATTAVLQSPNHPIGSYVQASDGVYVIVRASSGTIMRRLLASQLALQSWTPPSQVVPANQADLALPVDQWVRGFADGVLASVDGQLSVISLGVARPITQQVAGQLGLHDALPITSADVGHAVGQPAVAGAGVTTYTGTFTATALSPGGGTATTSWPHTFYGTPVPTPVNDPALP